MSVSLPTRLQALYDALLAARRPAPQPGDYIYTLAATTVSDPAILALVETAVGSAAVEVTGPENALRIVGETVVLTGSASFRGADGATLSFTFSESGQDITLDFESSLPQDWNLSKAFPALENTYFQDLKIQNAVLRQSGSTARPASDYGLTGAVRFVYPLEQVAAIIGDPGEKNLSGSVSLDPVQPLVQLTVDGVYSVSLGQSFSFNVQVILITSLQQEDASEDASLLAAITLRGNLTVSGNQVVITAAVPVTPGLVVFEGTFAPSPSVSLGSLDFWGDDEALLEQTVPPDMRQPQIKFDLKAVRIGLITPTKKVVFIGFVIGGPDWKVVDPGQSNVGILLEVVGVSLDISVLNPFDPDEQRSFGRLRGNVNTSFARFYAEATTPGFELLGQLAEGSTFKPSDVLRSVAPSIALPAGVPDPAITVMSLMAAPLAGTAYFRMESLGTWLVFNVGTQQFSLSDLGLSVDRLQSRPDGSSPVMSATLFGTISIADILFDISAFSPVGGEGWQFSASLVNYLAFPSINSIVASINPSWSNALPSDISNLGQNISINELELQVSSALRSMGINIGSGAGWEGWKVIEQPFLLKLVSVRVMVTADSNQGFKGVIRGDFGVGGVPVKTQVALPFSSGDFSLSLDEDEQGVAAPTVKDIVALLNRTWADNLPQAIADLGSTILLKTFTVTVKGGQTSVLIVINAAQGTQPWTVITGPPIFSLHNLGVTLTSSKGTTEGSIRGTIIAGQGQISLRVGLSDQWTSFTVSLDPNEPGRLPTIGEIAGLFDSSWPASLPVAIAQIGEGMVLRQFDLTRSQGGQSAIVKIGNPQNWAGYTPVAGFTALKFTAFETGFAYQSTAQPTLTGAISASASVIDQPMTFKLTVPDIIFVATLDTPQFNVKGLCGYIMGADVVPSWMERVGLLKTELAADFKNGIYTIETTIAQDIPLPNGGKLEKGSMVASYGGPGDPKVCLKTAYITPGVVRVPGEICYPFDAFKPPNSPEMKPFPPSVPPYNPNPPPLGDVVNIIGALLGLGGISLAGTFVIMKFGYGVKAKITAAAGLMLGGGTFFTLFEVMNSLLGGYTEFAGKPGATVAEMSDSYKLAKDKDATAKEMSPATKLTFPALSASEMATALAGTFTLNVAMMAVALAAAPYPPEETAPVLRSRYPEETKEPEVMVSALKQAYPDIAAEKMAAILAASPYDSLLAAPALRKGFPHETATALQMAALLKGAYTNPPLGAPAMTAALAASAYPAYETARALMLYYPVVTTTALKLIRLMADAGYQALYLLSAIRIIFPLETRTALRCAELLRDAHYDATQARTALLANAFTKRMVRKAINQAYKGVKKTMLLTNVIQTGGDDEAASFEITSSANDLVSGKIPPASSRYVVPAGTPPYSVRMGTMPDFSDSITVTGITSADVVATFFRDSAGLVRIAVAYPNQDDFSGRP